MERARAVPRNAESGAILDLVSAVFRQWNWIGQASTNEEGQEQDIFADQETLGVDNLRKFLFLWEVNTLMLSGTYPRHGIRNRYAYLRGSSTMHTPSSAVASMSNLCAEEH